MKSWFWLLLAYCSIGYTQELIPVGTLKAKRLMDYKISVSKRATSAIRQIDSTYGRAPLNKYDSLVKDYLFTNELATYRYEVPYQYRGKKIMLSGLVIVPKGEDKGIDIMYYHGTRPPWGILAVPSNFSEKKKPKKMFYELKYLLMLADLGYTVFVPDYIGYGASKKTEHPYTVVEPNVKASFEVYSNLKKAFDTILDNKGELIACGVSEGGGYALGLHHYLENTKEIAEVSSYPCEGPYDYGATLSWVFDETPKSKFGILVYIWSAYSQLDYYFPNSLLMDSLFLIKNMKQKKVFKIKRFFGKNDSPYKYVDRELAQNLVKNEVKEFNTIMKINTIYTGWVPKGNIDFFHSGQDMLVPVINTENAYKSLSLNSEKIRLHLFQEKGHKTLIDTYFGYLIENLVNESNKPDDPK